MSDKRFAFLVHSVDKALSNWRLAWTIYADEIAALITEGVAYWEQRLPDGSHLALIRFFSPVVRREEVFLGNVLLNDFLSKALIRAVEGSGLGRMQLLANDLESYYYLYHGQSALDEMVEQFRQEVQANLSRLYFDDEDPASGIYGDVARMLTFYKSNIEPFPAFAVPRHLLPELLEKINQGLLQLVGQDETNINIILAILSFFYARDGAEMQSPYTFLRRTMDEGLVPAREMKAAFVISPEEDFDKATFNKRKNKGVIDRLQLRKAIEQFVHNVRREIRAGRAEMMAAYLASKMPGLPSKQAASVLCKGVQVGFLPLMEPDKRVDKEERLSCRFCGTDAAIIVEKNITGGFGAGRFYNQSPKLRPFEEALCGRCGISGYLVTKLLGMHIARPQPKAKDYPVPKQYNLVFHYGRHDEGGIQHIRQMIDELFDLIVAFQERAREEQRFFSVEYIREEIARRIEERQAGEAEISDAEEALAALLDDEAVLPGLETLGEMRRDVQAQVLPLGVGDYRLLAFILPQLQPGRDEALDFVQKRFSKSRLAAFTLLALLRKLCGCDGPYYFQSVPTLAPGGFDPNTFYVQGKAENADKVLRRYSAIVNFARQVVKWRQGRSLLADWILLAERLEEDPLGTFSDVLRDSPLRGGDDLREARYRRLSNEFVKGMGVVDGTEYLRLIEALKQL
jgi:hypothetical protein